MFLFDRQSSFFFLLDWTKTIFLLTRNTLSFFLFSFSFLTFTILSWMQYISKHYGKVLSQTVRPNRNLSICWMDQKLKFQRCFKDITFPSTRHKNFKYFSYHTKTTNLWWMCFFQEKMTCKISNDFHLRISWCNSKTVRFLWSNIQNRK
jgi:hypothetical protein